MYSELMCAHCSNKNTAGVAVEGRERKRDNQREKERRQTERRSKYKKTPASVCQRDTPVVCSESPSLRRITNDSPG